jgi:hypothetical protein
VVHVSSFLYDVTSQQQVRLMRRVKIYVSGVAVIWDAPIAFDFFPLKTTWRNKRASCAAMAAANLQPASNKLKLREVCPSVR